jgi:hypothetical protein
MQRDQDSFRYWRAPMPPRKVPPLDLSAERALLAQEQTKAARLKNAIASGQYLETTEVIKAAEAIFSVSRENILSLAGKISDAVASYAPGSDRPQIYRIIAGECRELLVGLSDEAATLMAVQKLPVEIATDGDEPAVDSDPLTPVTVEKQ